MKILYVGDNRIRGNFGCRATSTALSMLISENHEIVGRVSGICTMTGSPVFYYKYFPKIFYHWCGKLPEWNKVQPFVARVMSRLKNKSRKPDNYDFISLDMERSIKNLKKCMEANPILSQLDIDKYDFDALVVNGEGSFIFTTPQWREPLVISMCIYWALKLKKKVFFMNAMFSDDPHSERNEQTIRFVENLLKQCDIVNVRESVSLKYVKEHMPSISPLLLPDALFTWYDIINDEHKVLNGKYYIAHTSECDETYYNQDFTQPYILLSGSSSRLIHDNINTTISVYVNLVNTLREKYTGEIFFIQVCEGDSFLREVSNLTSIPFISMGTPILAASKILSNAQVYISGRYHPAIMASIGGTPCVFMGSNSHKTASLQELLEYPIIKEYPVIPSREDIEEMVRDTLIYVNNQEEIRNKIKERARNLSVEAYRMKDYIKG